jgi:hypothetical protein
MEDELEKVKRRILEAEADLKRAQAREDRELELESRRSLNILLKIEE